ncbi:MAG: ion channel [Fusobacteriaceae bacterium]
MSFNKKLFSKQNRIFFYKYSFFILFVSILIPIILEVKKLFFLEKTNVELNFLYFIPVLFFNMIPIVLVRKKDLFLKDSPVKALVLIFYYLIFLPIFNTILSDDSLNEIENFNIVKLVNIINLILLFYSHFILLKYTFLDIFLKKREIKSRDILVIFLLYITIAISFGSLYTVISLWSNVPAFNGINYAQKDLYFYFKHVYFSFITLTTVGYGDVTPTIFITEFLSILEIIVGIALINFSLGVTLGAGIFNFRGNNNNNNRS